ncbi:tetratricopeptide repeat protein [Polynucleobacter necessarius]|uniref:tetratricopeptide repeat protein n=1 Tax=Polynucleobacter necessarius TaxID=576610 RepID=UPI000E099F30|nr:tetratricopeptide repeat protein [Polynucleobacter necessarius]
MVANRLQENIGLAEQYFLQNNFSLAKSILEDVIKEYPDSPRANELLAYVVGNEGDLNNALSLLEKAVSFKDCSPTAFYELGSIYLSCNEDEKAGQVFQKAIALGLKTFGLHFEYGQALA